MTIDTPSIGVSRPKNQQYALRWHPICTCMHMRRSDDQSTFSVPDVMSQIDESSTMLSAFNNPKQFSDAGSPSKSHAADPSNPAHIIAVMVQTRRQCRPCGLIKRDHKELIQIGQQLGLSESIIEQIIKIMHESDLDSPFTSAHAKLLSGMESDFNHKKTRVQPRVLVGLSIWALTIAIAMQMSH